MVPAALDHSLQVGDEKRHELIGRMAILLDHVLEEDKPKSVSVVIPPLWVNLLVQADHVEAEHLCSREVELQCFISGRCILPVGPPGLIQEAGQKGEFTVEERLRRAATAALRSALDIAQCEGAEAEVGQNSIALSGHPEIIEVRRIRGPKLGRWHLEGDPFARESADRDYFPPPIQDFDVDFRSAISGKDVGRNCDVRCRRLIDRQGPNVGLWNPFKPNCLPDAAAGRIGVPSRFVDRRNPLFTVRLIPCVARVEHIEEELIPLPMGC
mmetsp:Transcript_54938/g.117914  ORF Transcript_54938/g.117914 Transcript_54938/m.117914 type:complete len:269 (-) Transcript_54938:669-1475(-)